MESRNQKKRNRNQANRGACFRKFTNENFLTLARKIFTSRTKTKKFPRHVFQNAK